MNLTGHDVLKFDEFLPIYNWIYPLAGSVSERFGRDAGLDVFSNIQKSRSRALYVHIPFCESICSFCPFVRGKYRDASEINAYVDALLTEINLKANYEALTNVPIGAIFFGGGTPSLLNPDHIRRIGHALHSNFDLSQVREFSFEFEVKSATEERVEALRDIGVTHARFGAQTFSETYRKLFGLTASLDDIRNAARLLLESFPYVSCDVMYGMNGQSEVDVLQDVEAACALELDNMDFYPINNVATPRKLHRQFQSAAKRTTSGLTKFYMKMMIREALSDRGYLPHNGHGFVRVSADELSKGPAVTDQYSFVYHEHTLGFPEYDLLGFGTNAISSFAGYSVFNTSSRKGYTEGLQKQELAIDVLEHDPVVDASRPLSLALPYHGRIPKDWVDWTALPKAAGKRLGELMRSGLIEETKDEYALTRSGWEWYSNVMYYLLPLAEQKAVRDLLLNASKDDFLGQIEPSGLEGFPFGN